MTRLWIVEAMFQDGTWEICWFGTKQFASTNFYNAHKIKRKQYERLRSVGPWKKKNFRVREYLRK